MVGRCARAYAYACVQVRWKVSGEWLLLQRSDIVTPPVADSLVAAGVAVGVASAIFMHSIILYDISFRNRFKFKYMHAFSVVVVFFFFKLNRLHAQHLVRDRTWALHNSLRRWSRVLNSLVLNML